MSRPVKVWLAVGAGHLALLAAVFAGCGVPLAVAQNPAVPVEDKARPVPAPPVGIAEVRLDNLTPAAKATDVIELKPGQIKAFASGDGISWLLTPVSDDATDDGLATEEAPPGSVIFSHDIDREGKFGRLKVPADQSVLIVACNPDSAGKYLLVKQQVVAGRVVTVSKVYLLAGKKKDDPRPPPIDDHKPTPVVKSRRLAMIVVEETDDKAVRRAKFLSDSALADRIKAKGHAEPVVVDQNVKDGKTKDTPAKLKPYVARAKGKSLPQLYLVDIDSGEVVYEGPLPDAVADIVKTYEKVGG